MGDPDHYNPLKFSTGLSRSLNDSTTFGETDEFLPYAAPAQNNPRVQITEPSQYPSSQSQYQNQLYSAHRATPFARSRVLSGEDRAEELYWQRYGRRCKPAFSDDGKHSSACWFSEGLANLNFGGQVPRAQSPLETTANFTYYQQQASRGPTIAVPPNDELGSQHSPAGASPGSMSAQRPDDRWWRLSWTWLGGNYASSASSAYSVDNEYSPLNGGTGPDRGRRTRFAASERSPYHHPLTLAQFCTIQ